MLVIIHRGCSGPAIDTDTVVAETCALPVDRFPFTCFSCLEEIIEESEIRFSEEIRM